MGTTPLINQLFEEATELCQSVEAGALALLEALDGLDAWTEALGETVAEDGDRLHAALETGREALEARAEEVGSHGRTLSGALGELAAAAVARGQTVEEVAAAGQAGAEALRAAVRAGRERVEQGGAVLDAAYAEAIAACEQLDQEMVAQIQEAGLRVNEFAADVDELGRAACQAVGGYVARLQELEEAARREVAVFDEGSESAVTKVGSDLYWLGNRLIELHNEAVQGPRAGDPDAAAADAGVAPRLIDHAPERARTALLAAPEALATLAADLGVAEAALEPSVSPTAAELADEVMAASGLAAAAAEAIPAGACTGP
jgi:hypothetical protein